MENEKIKRDYDENPIIIEDHNSLFIFLFLLNLLPIMILVYIYNPGDASEESLFRNIFLIIPLTMYPYARTYFKSKGKRKILLLNETIKFIHESNIIEEIEIKKISEIKKTYSDIYHKSQKMNLIEAIGIYIIYPLVVIISSLYYLLLIPILFHFFLIITKFIFHKMKDINYSFCLFDSFIIFEHEDKFINILPTNNSEYQEIRSYL